MSRTWGNIWVEKIPKISGHVWKALKLDENVLESVMKKALDGFDKAKDFLQLLQ